MIPKEILIACNSNVDDSPSFHQRMNRLAEHIAQKIYPVNMESISYSSSVFFRFISDGKNLLNESDERASFEVVVYLSMRASFFTYICYKYEIRDRKTWKIQSEDPPFFKAIFEELECILLHHGFVKISEDFLHEIVPGFYTEMDGAPATVFNRIFSELEI